MAPLAVTRRINTRGSFKEEAAFLPFYGTEVFTMTYLPAGSPRVGLVICSSLLVEQLTNYRRDVLLARELARRNIAVLRFHYRGSGHSQGDDSTASWETLVQDARFAGAHLRSRTSVNVLSWMGARWGALVAAAAGRDQPSSPLLLWEPVVQTERYFQELFRSRRVRELNDGRFSATDWREEMAGRGHVDILGHAFHRRLYESTQGRRLDALLAGTAHPTMIVQFGRGRSPRPDYQRLGEAIARGGGHLDIAYVHDEPAWFFPGYQMKSVDRLLSISCDWLCGAAVGRESGG